MKGSSGEFVAVMENGYFTLYTNGQIRDTVYASESAGPSALLVVNPSSSSCC